MALQNIDQILKRAGNLTPSERLLIASRLIQGGATKCQLVNRTINGATQLDFYLIPRLAWMRNFTLASPAAWVMISVQTER